MDVAVTVPAESDVGLPGVARDCTSGSMFDQRPKAFVSESSVSQAEPEQPAFL